MSSNRPWFFAQSLRAKLSADILEALAAGRISAAQAQWLQSLFVQPDNGAARPRVDQLLREEGAPDSAGLADALIISDDTGNTADFYLSSALYGLERFDNRAQLLGALPSRVALHGQDLAKIEYQRIEGELFAPLAMAVMDQQVRQLRQLSECLERLPALEQALGQALQEKLDAQLPGTAVNVFTHVAQIKTVGHATHGDTPVASRTLAQMAMAALVNQPLPAGLRYQWLASDGQELSEGQAVPWQQALGAAAGGLTSAYESLLRDYWDTSAGGGVSHREVARQVVAERFRQHMLQARHEASLGAAEFAALRSLFQSGEAWAQALQVSRLSIQIGVQEPVKMAGICLIAFTGGQVPGLLLYSAEKGLRRFADLHAVAGYFSGADVRIQLFSHASFNDQPLLRAQGALHVRLDRVTGAPFANLAESVIGLQKRNLADALRHPLHSPAQATIAINAALDIRCLLDPRLCVAGDRGRWDSALANSERNWLAFNSPARMPALRLARSRQPGDLSTFPWIMYLADAWNRVNSLCAAHPSLADCAQKVLNRYLSVLAGEAVDSATMWFRNDEQRVVSLSVLLVERVSGHRAAALPEHCPVYVDPPDAVHAQQLAWLTPALLEAVLSRAQKTFTSEYSRLIRAFYREQLRISGASVIPANASRQLREGLLRLQLNMQRDSQGNVSRQGLGMLQQVLDWPVFTLRETFGNEATEVFIPALRYDSRAPAVRLSNVLIVQQPLHGDSKPLLWSTLTGLHEVDSMDELQRRLKAGLEFPGSRERWLQLIAVPDQERLRGFLQQGDTRNLAVNLFRVEENVLERLELDELDRQCHLFDAAYRNALAWQVDARLFEHMLSAAAQEARTRDLIGMLSGELEMTLLEGEMPDWLKQAPVYDLLLFRHLLVRFRQRYTAREAIAPALGLEQYAAGRLKQCLNEDFPAIQPDPALIIITLTRYTGTPGASGEVPSSVPAATSVISESLTSYAINRFSQFQDASLSVSADQSTLLPAALDASYVRELVRRLDIASGYQHYLKATFSETAPDYFDRRNQFSLQAPSALLLAALSLKLQGVLSATGYTFVENVIGMPDGVARLAVAGQYLEFSPLQLVCAPGYAADRVTGVFLITPQDRAQGPWILHVVADVDYLFKEYAGQSEFLADLYSSQKLQAILLERMDPAVRFIYERGGFIQPHLSWATGGFTDLSDSRVGPVQASFEPVRENVLHVMFRTALQILLLRAEKHSVTTAEDDSAARRFLLLQGIEQTLMFLPGRLGGLVGVWQAQDLLQAGLDSASKEDWGKATAQFASALAVVIATRQQVEDSAPPASNVVDAQAGPRWHDPQLQVDLSARLQQFEVHDVSLSHLQRDRALDVYNDAASGKQYAAVYGKVYQVKSKEGVWYVIEGARQGPRIRPDAAGDWVLDTELGSRRDGGALTRLRSARTNMDVDDILLVEARGIPEIQRLYPQKAAQIAESHELARQYLENALNNLTVTTPQSPLDPRVARIITDFFGVSSLNNVSVIPIKETFADIYQLLMDPELSPHSSDRYVVGTNKLGYESSTAFTFANDPLQRIFLSERYFLAPYVRLKPWLVHQGSFNAGSHFRAAILIHELSHIANNTHDIAYVDSSAPYLDLLEDTGSYRARLKLEHIKAQNSFSHRTPREDLFKIDDEGLWRDFKNDDSDAKRVILRIAGRDSLEAARDRFLYDDKTRARLILSNADSVALLATLLGRERFLPLPVSPARVLPGQEVPI